MMGDRQWPDPQGWEALTQAEAEADARKHEVSFQTRRMVAALALELPGEVWDDVNARIEALLAALAVAERERDEARKVEARLREASDALVLTWRCETCGWETTLPVPGFGGDGRYHYPDGSTPCGPLSARRAALAEEPQT